MLSTAPTLHICRPSPTTIEYTVSTKPLPSLTYSIVFTITSVLRVLAISSSFLVLLLLSHHRLGLPATTSTSAPDYGLEYIPYILGLIIRSPVATFYKVGATAAPLPIVMVLTALGVYVSIQRPQTTESLLVLRGLGIQTSSSPPTYLSGTRSRFIPTSEIQDLFVNEAFKGWEVRYYLVVIVKGEGKGVVVFERLLPRRSVVEGVWRGARRALWDDGEDNRGKGEKKGASEEQDTEENVAGGH